MADQEAEENARRRRAYDETDSDEAAIAALGGGLTRSGFKRWRQLQGLKGKRRAGRPMKITRPMGGADAPAK
jgi:hypothetical protein